jgi:hypothetical protein
MKQVANLPKIMLKFPIFVSVGLHAGLLYLLILGGHTISHSKQKSIYVRTCVLFQDSYFTVQFHNC